MIFYLLTYLLIYFKNDEVKDQIINRRCKTTKMIFYSSLRYYEYHMRTYTYRVDGEDGKAAYTRRGL